MDEEDGQNWLTGPFRKSSFTNDLNCVELGWRKSSRTTMKDCVELNSGQGLVRDTKNRTGPKLRLSIPGLVAFAKAQ